MSKEPRKKVVIRRTLRSPEERREPSASPLILLGLGILGLVGLIALLGPLFVFVPSFLILLGVWLHVRELERFGRPTLLRAPLRRLRLWLRGDAIVHCPLCRDLVVEDEDPLSDCSGCNVRYHAACRDELGSCATLGCPERRLRPGFLTRAKLKSF